eukprot:5372367-Amphidinium_carterae.1
MTTVRHQVQKMPPAHRKMLPATLMQTALWTLPMILMPPAHQRPQARPLATPRATPTSARSLHLQAQLPPARTT